jgi:hypothetical protein
LVRESVVAFIEATGHKTELEILDAERGTATIRLRVRGQIFAVGTTEADPAYYSVSLAFALPEWARDRGQHAPILLQLQATFKAVKFFFAHDGAALIVAIEQFSGTPEEFTQHFWRIVGIVRDAGTTAIEHILDRSETKAAAEKFINDFMRGQS